MLDLVTQILLRNAYLAILPPLFLAAILFRRLSPASRIAAYCIFLGACTEIAGRLLWQLNQNNLWIIHLYTGLEFCLITLFFKQVLGNHLPDRLIYYGLAGFVLFVILNSLFLQDISRFNSNARTLEGILVIGLCLTFYYRLITDAVQNSREQWPEVWIVAGWLLYFSGSLLLFVLSNYFMDYYDRRLNKYYWSIHALFVIVMYLLFTIGLWIQRGNFKKTVDKDHFSMV